MVSYEGVWRLQRLGMIPIGIRFKDESDQYVFPNW